MDPANPDQRHLFFLLLHSFSLQATSLFILKIKVWFFIIQARALKREVEPKGQLISKCHFGVKYQQFYLTISALEFKMWSNDKIKALYDVFNRLNRLYNHF